MNAPVVMAFLESPDLGNAEARAGAWIAGEYLKKGQVTGSFRIRDLERRFNWSSRYTYDVVQNLADKGCLVVDNRTKTGWLSVTIIAPERKAALRQSAKVVTPERNATDPLLAKEAKKSARARQAHSLTHPKGLARSPVDNGARRRRGDEPARIASSAADLLDGLVSKLDERAPAEAQVMRARLALRSVQEPKPTDLEPRTDDDDDEPF